MILILKPNTDQQQLDALVSWLGTKGLKAHISRGDYQTIVGLVGDTSQIDIDMMKNLDIVEDAKRVQEPYKKANRKFHPDDTIINVNGVKIGGGFMPVIAGPCSIETEEQICLVAKLVKSAGATMLRGGAFKPRTSPYSFQGLGADGLKLLLEAKKETGLPVVTEIMEISHLPLFEDVDVIQVGARNMQNFGLLKELGHVDKPILLKRGLANTLQELLMSAEYIMAGGNEKVILCERGIRTFETATRNTLDLSAVPMLHEMSHLPVVVDPSHSTGISRIVPTMSLAAVASGADGLIIEVHNDPQHALCDGAQSLKPEVFAELMKKIHQLMPLVGKKDPVETEAEKAL